MHPPPTAETDTHTRTHTEGHTCRLRSSLFQRLAAPQMTTGALASYTGTKGPHGTTAEVVPE